ncbi:MAG TPA: hypothetical protein VD834_14675 [Blastococcus sp.]|jgi:hypothetical protein|nr:hypothetical protein [Blastococcus sp.]
MNVPDDGRPVPSHRQEGLVGAAAAVIVSALVVLGLVISDPGAGDRPADAAAAPSAGSSSAGSSSSTGVPADGSAEPAPAAPDSLAPVGDASALPVALPAVALDQEASGEDGVKAQVVSLEAIDATAVGVGNIAGPALRATVRLTSATSEPVDLDLVSVTLTHGADGTPASPLDDPSRAPFAGMLEAGETAEGVYVFTVPEDDRDAVTVTVGYRAGAPFLVLSGSAD